MKPSLFLLLLLLLLPVCSAAEFRIDCFSRDPLGMQPPVLNCRSDVEQACYTRDNGEKGCVTLETCSRPGWTCCDGPLCNA